VCCPEKEKVVTATVLIIDNITCLRGGTENAVVALRVMKNLRANHGLSILVLAHTPKRRNPARPLSADDLQGSKLLINFADSAFAIGQSCAQTGLCYLRQIKQRNTRQVYSPDNVCLCRIIKEAPGMMPKPLTSCALSLTATAPNNRICIIAKDTRVSTANN